MKTASVVIVCHVSFAPLVTPAATTINATNSFAFGTNIGLVNWRGDVTNGAIVGEYVCSGSIWSANVDWINFEALDNILPDRATTTRRVVATFLPRPGLPAAGTISGVVNRWMARSVAPWETQSRRPSFQ